MLTEIVVWCSEKPIERKVEPDDIQKVKHIRLNLKQPNPVFF